MALKKVPDSFFGYRPAACTTNLSAEDYAAGLVRAFQAELGCVDDRVSRSQVEVSTLWSGAATGPRATST